VGSSAFPESPTALQAGGWREIVAGRDMLIAAPTGPGKTLAAFLVCIDRLHQAHQARADPEDRLRVSPSRR
jgi:ATP-dependent Lhr-like helicase